MVIPAYSVFEHKNGGENGYYKTGEKVAYLPGSCLGSKRHFRASSPIFWCSLASASMGVSSQMLNWKHFLWQFQMPHLTPGSPRW
jgi:hypothetical protein